MKNDKFNGLGTYKYNHGEKYVGKLKLLFLNFK